MAADIRAIATFLIVGVAVLCMGCGEDAILPEPSLQDEPAYVTDSQIAFVSDRDGYTRIYVMNTDGTNQRPLSDPVYGSDTWPAWSPDGARIAFTSDPDGMGDIFVMDADGGDRRNLSNTEPAEESHPTWSPDGAQIAFEGRYPAGIRTMVVDGDGAAVESAREISSAETDRRPTWSPGGTRFAFVIMDRIGAEVFTMDADGRDRSRLRLASTSDEPAWSPDGRSIALTVINPKQHGAREGLRSIMVRGLVSGVVRIVTDNPRGNDESPTWSPDGRSIAYAARDGARSDIHVVNLDDGTVTQLTNTRHFDGMPSWSP